MHPVTDLTGASEQHDDCSAFGLLAMIEGPDLLAMVEGPGFSLLVDVAEGLPCLVGLPVIGNAKRSCARRIWPFGKHEGERIRKRLHALKTT